MKPDWLLLSSPAFFSSAPSVASSRQYQRPLPALPIPEEETRRELQLSKRKLSLSLLLAFPCTPIPIFFSVPSKAISDEDKQLALERYTDTSEGFTLLIPSSWIKAGATVLFEQVNKGINNVGVVVTPVRLNSLGEFGTPQFVADKLILAEKRKTTGSLYFWAAHLAGPKWGPLASWCCAWLETIGLIAGIGTQAYAGSQTLQSIILLSTGTNKNGGYFAPRWLFLCMYIGLTLIWAVLNTFALEVIALIDIVSMWWQLIGGIVIVIMLPLVSLTRQSASYVFTHFETSESTGITSKAYAVILSVLVSQYSLYGYDAAAHLTEETKGADMNGPIAILSSIGIISFFGWAYILALTFSIQDPSYLFDPNNETAGAFVPAQILYDAFHGRYNSSTGAIILLFVIWGSFFFGGLSITTSAARVVYALSRDNGVPFSSIWRKVHPKHKVPSNAVWLCAGICILLGLPILKLNVVFTAITSICTIGWVGGYAVPIFARLVMDDSNFKPGPFYLKRARRPICLVAFLWICYTCCVFLLPTLYPIKWDTFNYAPVALGIGLTTIMLWWVLDARKWFKGPVRNIDDPNGKV